MERPAASPPARRRIWAAYSAVFLLCGVFFLLVFRHARAISATYDENAHLAAGYSYLESGDFRMNPEHPPLIKLLAALPLLGHQAWQWPLELTEEDLEPGSTPAGLLAAKRAWTAGLVNIDAQWAFGHAFLYAPREETLNRMGIRNPLLLPTTARYHPSDFRNDADSMLIRARIPIMLLGVGLAVLVFCWARELHGLAGGLLALLLFCFDPNFVAHSGLVTNDVAISLFIFGAVYFLWRTCRRPTAPNLAGTIAFFAFAFATKFSAVALIPAFILIGAAVLLSPGDLHMASSGRLRFEARVSRMRALAGLMAACAAAALFLIWVVYGFRYSAAADPARAAEGEKVLLKTRLQLPPQPWRAPGHFPVEAAVRRTAAIQSLFRTWPQGPPDAEIERAMPRAPLGVVERLILSAREARLLPEAYLAGFAFARMNSLLRGSFLRGEYSERGFPFYFLWTFLLKTPLPAIASILAALCVILRKRRPWRLPEAFFFVPLAVYLLVLVASNLGIGHRHLLPIYPFLYVLCGGLAPAWRAWGVRLRLASALPTVTAIAVSSFVVFAPPWKPALVYPHYLAYFNELAGGPGNGYDDLEDSNIDWGQDLKKLRDWLERRNITEPINLCYFGMADPRYYGIAHVGLPGGYVLAPGESFENARIPGYLAVSTTNLMGVYFVPQQREAWRRFLNRARFVDSVGFSIFVFYLDKPGESGSPPKAP